MDRYVCIHGHFYQPPRENPWSDRVEPQPSAAPYPDWNQRIDAECYAANAAAPVLDAAGRVRRRVNNYERISFNFGPTLLAWMERHRPAVYAAVLEADRRSRSRFGGHGSALAQGYHHAILPLAHPRDRRTEVRWGMADFRHRFGRAPEGMWLPEAAVDVASLEALAEEGIRFTLLEPHQAARWRPLDGDGPWRPVAADGSGLDTSQPYLCLLPSGRSMALFFYDGPTSREVAFHGLLHDGAGFAGRLLSRFDERPGGNGLLTIATDGETYGHHHRFGEMALAFALGRLEEGGGARLTNLGEFLALHPPRCQVEIRENTSWSCPHGVARWSRDCVCGRDGAPLQVWREPLRDALVWLRDALAGPWEAAAGECFAEPWAARDAYVGVLLDPSPEREADLLAHHGRPGSRGGEEGRRRALALLELQRNALRMFTSCGWFFEDVGRLETRQILQYAARALELARDLLDLEGVQTEFLTRLAHARSRDPRLADGRTVFEHHVAAARRRGLASDDPVPPGPRAVPPGAEGAPAE